MSSLVTTTSTACTTTAPSVVVSTTDNTSNSTNKKVVAVIGGGVTGLAASWHLKTCSNNSTTTTSSKNTSTVKEVHLYESANRLGGHAWTVPVSVPSDSTSTSTSSSSVSDSTTSSTNKENEKKVINVDIGFMVYNEYNYPNMTEWFKSLDVSDENSDMSFAVSLLYDDTKYFEWCSSNGISGLHLSKLSFYYMIYDILRFNTNAIELLKLHKDDSRKYITTYNYLQQNNYNESFILYYLLPMMAALWSASIDDILQYPIYYVICFLYNHKMLQLLNRPQWKTVASRSQQYTSKVYTILQDNTNTNENQSQVFLSAQVHSIEQQQDTGKYIIYYTTTTTDDDTDADTNTTTKEELKSNNILYDDIIFACHPPQAASILERSKLNNTTTTGGNNSTIDLLQTLKNIVYADNTIYVHSDKQLMPQSKSVWSSWNCIGKYNTLYNNYYKTATTKKNSSNTNAKKQEAFEGASSGFGNSININSEKDTSSTTTTTTTTLDGENGRFQAVYITYWLNRLQNLQTDTNIFVSLNPHQQPSTDLTHYKYILGHPQFTTSTITAREKLLSSSIYQGYNNLWFCGAWDGYGFHEDGCRSGFTVATQLSNVPLPWSDATKYATGMTSTITQSTATVLPPPNYTLSTNTSSSSSFGVLGQLVQSLYQTISYTIPVSVCKYFIRYFLKNSIKKGVLQLKYNDGTIESFGNAKEQCGCDNSPITLRIFDSWFFVKTALEYDLGLARSYMAGYFTIEPLDNATDYHPTLRPHNTTKEQDETTIATGDPIGLTRLFLLFIGNRDSTTAAGKHIAKKSARGLLYSNAFSNASGLLIGKIGSFINYIRYKLTMDNSERGGSLKNIHSHYDLSNDLFTTFLDKETLMYSSAIYDTIPNSTNTGLLFRGSLEEAQIRKLDTLLSRAQVQPGHVLLDIGFGWGGLSIHAAQKYGCTVVGITLSVEQKALAEQRIRTAGVDHLITFEVIDYRTFARNKNNQGKFDRVLSCEMIEAVGHEHLGDFFWVVEQVLTPNGILVMEAITTPEVRYENYIRTTDFINTIIFPGSCCPSLHALVNAAYNNSSLTLEHIDNIGLHYAQTLAEWRRRFNANIATVRQLGFDDIFIRAWNYYLTYCEAGFFSQTENCLILVFSHQGCTSLVPLCETRSVTQPLPISSTEITSWITDSIV